MHNQNDLLTPELQKSKIIKSGFFSTKALMLSSFFIGPVAPILMGAFNSKAFGKWKTDIAIFAALAIIYILSSYYWASCFSEATNLAELGSIRSSDPFLKFFMRGLGLAFYLVVYLIHKKSFKAAEFYDVSPRSPWAMVAVAILIESLIRFPFLYFFGIQGGS